MIRFVNLNNGAVYNGDAPYIHWFDDEQSVNLNYIKRLCIICDHEIINVSINENNVFTLLNLNQLADVEDININGFSYKDINKFKQNIVESTGYLYSTKQYIHVIYILASCKEEGEYIEDLYIDGNKFLIGSSFYEKYEPHKINLSNLGVEIPESVTRAIYESNVHEDECDNILINRKFKELLNEYWNIVANKGSYKSLCNALAWFEYGDLIKIQELWKNPDKYNQQDINSYIEGKVQNYLSNHKKTTYIGIYLSLQQLNLDENNNVTYPSIINNDDLNIKEYKGFIREENPELIKVCTKWSNEDLSLKMYLLGNFFETYFTPIHLDLIHSTIENIVFANTIKVIHESKISRADRINNFFSFKCNVKDGDIFFLDNVNTQTNKNTIAGAQWNPSIINYDNAYILGVNNIVENIEEKDFKTFFSQYYNGIGKVVDFSCDINIERDDFIKQLKINLLHEGKVISDNFKLLLPKEDKEYTKNIQFSILCKQEGEYIINIEFITANQRNYVKTVKFSILDNTYKYIEIYKVKYNSLPEHTDTSKYPSVSNYMLSQYRDDPNKKSEYTKYFIPKDANDIKLQRTIAVKGVVDNPSNNEVIRNSKRIVRGENSTVFILPAYIDVTDYQLPFEKTEIIKDDWIFYPENHHLEKIAVDDSITLEKYTFTQKDVLMVIPNTKYLKYIEEPEWEFINVSKGNSSKPITIQSSRTPFIANTEYKLLEPGFYNIKFRYKLGNNIQEVFLDSAFRII